jgi:hypothetical protein
MQPFAPPVLGGAFFRACGFRKETPVARKGEESAVIFDERLT